MTLINQERYDIPRFMVTIGYPSTRGGYELLVTAPEHRCLICGGELDGSISVLEAAAVGMKSTVKLFFCGRECEDKFTQSYPQSGLVQSALYFALDLLCDKMLLGKVLT